MPNREPAQAPAYSASFLSTHAVVAMMCGRTFEWMSEAERGRHLDEFGGAMGVAESLELLATMICTTSQTVLGDGDLVDLVDDAFVRHVIEPLTREFLESFSAEGYDLSPMVRRVTAHLQPIKPVL